MTNTFYNLNNDELTNPDFLKNNLIGFANNQFVVEPKKSQSWFGKQIRWIKGTYRLDYLYNKIQKEVAVLQQDPNEINSIKLKHWMAILPGIQDLIETHNKRCTWGFFTMPSLVPLLHKFNLAWTSLKGRFYQLDLSEISQPSFWDKHILTKVDGEFYVQKKVKLSWLQKLFRWKLGESRLDVLQKDIQTEIEKLHSSKDKKLKHWEKSLCLFQRNVIDVHNQRRWFSKIPSFTQLMQKIGGTWAPIFFPRTEGWFMPNGRTPDTNFRQKIWLDTKNAIEGGYFAAGNYVKLDNETVKKGSSIYEKLLPIVVPKMDKPTEFVNVNKDTYQAVRELIAKGFEKIAAINMAHKGHPGGGVKWGASAQEEALCRSSNLLVGLMYLKMKLWNDQFSFEDFWNMDELPPPIRHAPYIPVEGGAYTKDVSVFRTHLNDGFKFLDQPFQVDVISVAAFDLRDESDDRVTLGLPYVGKIDAETLRKNEKYMNGTYAKIVQMLRKLAMEGREAIVLGPAGCGAFANDPEIVAELFEKAFKTDEFRWVFKMVAFASLEVHEGDKANTKAFTNLCERLNGARGPASLKEIM